MIINTILVYGMLISLGVGLLYWSYYMLKHKEDLIG